VWHSVGGRAVKSIRPRIYPEPPFRVPPPYKTIHLQRLLPHNTQRCGPLNLHSLMCVDRRREVSPGQFTLLPEECAQVFKVRITTGMRTSTNERDDTGDMRAGRSLMPMYDGTEALLSFMLGIS
jgi:hypothetical protein